MADYVIDWATANLDGSTVVSGLGAPVTVTVSTPPDPYVNTVDPLLDGEFEYSAGLGGLLSYYPTAGTSAEVIIDFTDGANNPTEVANVTFNLLDVDQSGTNQNANDFDDMVEIFAYNSIGVRLAVTFTGMTTQTTTAYTVQGQTNIDPVEAIGVTITGEVASLRIVYSNGPDDVNAGWVGISNISFDEFIPTCFVRGTMIETDRGEVAIEALEAGDLVRTADHGFQPIRWIGSSSVPANGRRAPILFRKGSIGNTRDLLLSPAHRVVLQDWQAEVLFSAGELLAPAHSLVNDSTIIRQESDGNVEYFHILFDKHEIIFSEGAASESFHPGDVNAGSMAQQARDEIYLLFPELQHNKASYGPSARSTLRAHEAALLNM